MHIEREYQPDTTRCVRALRRLLAMPLTGVASTVPDLPDSVERAVGAEPEYDESASALGER